MKRLYWVRHGENRANLTKEFSHRRVDYPLTPKGVLQAQQTAAHLRGANVHEIYSSPLRRAVQTAEIIAAELGLQAVVKENFREVNVGDLEGQPVTAELWARHERVVGAWLAGRPAVRFPGGEDYATLWGRMRAGLAEIVARRARRNVIVVGHGGMLAVTLRDLCGEATAERVGATPIANCSITTLEIGLQDGRLACRLLEWASHDHLYGGAADLVPGTPGA